MASATSPDPRLPQDIIELIVDELFDDFGSLAVLCRISKAYTRVARKHLYYELDLVDDKDHTPGPGDPHPNTYLRLGEAARFKRRITMRENDHLWQHIKSLTITFTTYHYTPGVGNGGSSALEVLRNIRVPELEHIHIGLNTRRNSSFKDAHFRIEEQTRQITEALLCSSTHLKRFSVIIETVWKGDCSFPEWIFRSLPETVTKVSIKTTSSSGNSLFAGDLANLSTSWPKRRLTEFEFANIPCSFDIRDTDGRDSMLRCCTILSNLCFNYDFSSMRKLIITAMWSSPGNAAACDDTLWTIPNKAAGALEDLTILQFPSSASHLTIQDDHFVKYQSLQSITLSVHPRGPFLKTYYGGCSSLIALFSVPLPLTLRRVRVNIMVGTIHGQYGYDALDALPEAYLASWRELDKVLALHSPLYFLRVNLEWRSVRWSDELEREIDKFADKEERQVQFDARVQAMLQEWRELFSQTWAKGILNVTYTHHVVPPSSVVYQ